MKKIFSMVLVALMLITTSINVIADDVSKNITASVSFSAENNSLTVSGDIKSVRDRIPMTLVVKQNGNIVALAEILAVGRNEGIVSYSFDFVKLNTMLPDGELVIDISADMVNLSCQKTYPYVSVASQYNALLELNEAVASGDSAIVLDAISTNWQALGIDIEKLNGFSGDVPLQVAGTMMQSYDLPDACKSDEDIQQVKDALGEFNKVYIKGVTVGEFFAKTSTSGMSEWYDTYKDTYSLDSDIPDTSEDEQDMLIYVMAALKDDSFALRRDHMKDIANIGELSLSIYHQALLHNVEKGNSYIVRNIIDDFPTLLTINKSNWNALSEVKKGTVVTNVSGHAYKNFSELSAAIDSAVASMSSESKDDRYSGGSGGGKSWSVDSQMMTQPQNKVMGFTDIAHVGWAEPSIRYLYSKGIVNGKSEGVFAPDDVVTRAELVKMLAVALELKNTGAVTESFADVADDAWYADYVYAAVDHGLVQGNGNGLFNPEAPVSRQDAATVIYRAVKNKDMVQKAYFEDYESISPYARDAVDYLCTKGIVNGIGDGMFAPNAELSRAQAAKILHLFLMVV